jgi:hypothetical protein
MLIFVLQQHESSCKTKMPPAQQHIIWITKGHEALDSAKSGAQAQKRGKPWPGFPSFLVIGF